jgi:hypothetical protein
MRGEGMFGGGEVKRKEGYVGDEEKKVKKKMKKRRREYPTGT